MALLRYRDPGDGKWYILGKGPTGDQGPAGADGQPGTDGSGFTQANGDTRYLPLAGGSMLGPLDMGGQRITNLRPAVAATDVIRVDQIPERDAMLAQVADDDLLPRGSGDAWVETDNRVADSYDDEWIPLTMTSDWKAYGSPWSTPAYRKTPFGVVQFKGLIARISGSVAWEDFATLPTGYGCGVGNRLLFAVGAGGYAARVDVFENKLRYVGSVQGSGTSYVSLANIQYFAES